MSDEIITALIAAVGALAGIAIGEWRAGRRWKQELAAARIREEEAAAARERELGVTLAASAAIERRAATRDDYTVILQYLDLLDQIATLCLAAAGAAYRTPVGGSDVHDRSMKALNIMSALSSQAGYALAVDRGATDLIRNQLKVVDDQVAGHLGLEVALLSVPSDHVVPDVADSVRDRASWLQSTVENIRRLVRVELDTARAP